MPYSFHKKVLDLGKKLGYYKQGAQGTCLGYALTWIASSLIDEEETFEEFKRALFDIFDCAESNDSITLTTEQHDLLKSMAALQDSQQRFPEVSQQVCSEIIRSHGGLVDIYSEVSLYSLTEIRQLLRNFEEIVDKLNYPYEKFHILLSIPRHTTGLVYQKSAKLWQFKDINPESRENKPFQNRDTIAQEIFYDLNENNTTYIVLEVNAVSLKNIEDSFQLKNQLQRLRSPQKLTKEILNRPHIEALAIYSSRVNRLRVIQQLAKHSFDFNQSDHEGRTPLYMACLGNHIDIIHELLTHGANPNQVNYQGLSPLSIAMGDGRADIVNELLNYGANPNQVDRYGNRPLYAAFVDTRLQIFIQLLKHGANPNVTLNGLSLLQSCILLICLDLKTLQERLAHLPIAQIQEILSMRDNPQSINMIDALLEYGVNPNQTLRGIPLLHYSAYYGNIAITTVLLKYGANPNQVLKDGSTALSVASESGHTDIAALLLEHMNQSHPANPIDEDKNLDDNTDLNQDEHEKIDLATAVEEGDLEIISSLLIGGANPNQPNQEGITPFMYAHRNGDFDIISLLLTCGANTNQTADHFGNTPLLVFATYNGEFNMVALLLKHGANPNQTTNDGLSALCIATECKHSDIVTLLLHHGANPNQIRGGLSLLAIATCNQNLTLIRELLKYYVNILETDVAVMPVAIAILDNMTLVLTEFAKQGVDLNKKIAISPYLFQNKSDSIQKRAQVLIDSKSETMDKSGYVSVLPLEMAEVLGNVDVIDLIESEIEKNNADLNSNAAHLPTMYTLLREFGLYRNPINHFVINHRHTNPELQNKYDKQFGLVPYIAPLI